MWGNGEPQSGYFDAELLDGRRGLVPASFVQRLVGKYTRKKNKKKIMVQLQALKNY